MSWWHVGTDRVSILLHSTQIIMRYWFEWCEYPIRNPSQSMTGIYLISGITFTSKTCYITNQTQPVCLPLTLPALLQRASERSWQWAMPKSRQLSKQWPASKVEWSVGIMEKVRKQLSVFVTKDLPQRKQKFSCVDESNKVLKGVSCTERRGSFTSAVPRPPLLTLYLSTVYNVDCIYFLNF